MSECKLCGREDGHYLGCLNAFGGIFTPKEPAFGPEDAPEVPPADHCAYGDCENPKRPKGKGPAPKYCTEHSDPKNRK